MYDSLDEYGKVVDKRTAELGEKKRAKQVAKQMRAESKAYQKELKSAKKRIRNMRENRESFVWTFLRLYFWAFSFCAMMFSLYFPPLLLGTIPLFLYMTYRAFRPVVYKLLTPFRCVWRVCTYSWESSGNAHYSSTAKRYVKYRSPWMTIVFGVFGRALGVVLIFAMWAGILFFRPYADGVRLYTPSYEPGDMVVCETKLLPTNASKYMAVVVSKGETGYVCNVNGVEKEVERWRIRGKYVPCDLPEGFLLSCKQVFVHIRDGAEILVEKYKQSK